MKEKIEFLIARLDEEEQEAGSGWSDLRKERWETLISGRSVMTPHGILADIAAKRKIIELVPELESQAETIEDEWGGLTVGGEEIIDAMLQPFADHPDFREEWKA